jgi:DNA invertase Pin-like site-specific DNA recombinase
MTPASNTPAVLYLRVSSQAQGESGLGLEAQEAACRRECERRGWDVVDVITEVQSGAKDVRVGFTRACELARASKGVVVSAEASRFSRGSVAHVLSLYDAANRDGYALYALDMPEFDFASPMGEAMISFIAVVNRLERRINGQRTSAALRAKQARGEHVGPPLRMPPATVARLKALRAEGLSYRDIATRLNGEGVTTFSGGEWRKEYVFQTLSRYGASAPARHGEE